jgi:effector-binding domain-containing protein
MKTFSATLVTKKVDIVRVTVPNNYKIQQVEQELCNKASLPDEDYVVDVFHIREVTK